MAGQLIERGKDTWQIRVYLGRDPVGKKIFHTETVHCGKKEAQARLRAALTKRDEGRLVPSSRLTVEAYLQKWMEANGPSLAVTTARHYRHRIGAYVVPLLGSQRLDQVRPLDIQTMIAALQARGLAPLTVRNIVTILSTALEQAVRWGMLAVNPCTNTVRPAGGRQVAIQVFDEDAARAFLDAARDHCHGLIWELALVTGMRPEEYLGLTWPDIDWQAGRIRVARALVRVPTAEASWQFKEVKTASSRRNLDVPPALLARLRAHQRQQQLDVGARNEHHLLFVDKKGQPSPHNGCLERAFKKFLSRSGLPTMRLYDLRHTCATLLLKAGVNVKVVSERLGHASVKITLDTYAQVLPSMQAHAANQLDALLYQERPAKAEEA